MGAKSIVGRQHRFFQLDDDQLEYIFKRVVPNPEDGMNLLKDIKTQEKYICTDLQRRVGPKEYKAGDIQEKIILMIYMMLIMVADTQILHIQLNLLQEMLLKI